MKMRLKWMVVPAIALGLGGCKKEAPAESTETAPAEQPGVVEKAVETVKEAVKEVVEEITPGKSAEERAAKLGFAKHLPKNVEAVFTVYDAVKTVDRAKSLKIWKLIEAEMGVPADVGAFGIEDAIEEAAAEAGVEPAPAPGEEGVADAAVPEVVEPEVPVAEADPAAFSPKDLWGAEVTVALGDGSGQKLGEVLHLYSRYSYFQIREVVKMMLAQAKDPGSMSEFQGFEQMIANLINDPEGGVSTIEKMGVPPVYVAFKADPAKREDAAQQVSSSLGIIGSLSEFAEPVEVEKAGAKFEGYKLLGAKLSETMSAQREEMEKVIEADVLDRLFAAVAKQDVVVLSGTVGDHVLLFLGGSTDQLELVADPKDSLLGGDALAFVDGYLEKDLAVLSFGKKETLQNLVENASSFADTAAALRDGLSGAEGIGDTREIESLLQIVGEREKALRQLAKYDSSASVAFFEEGLKVESAGGIDQGMVDWSAKPKLGHLGDSSDVVLFANLTVTEAYDEASRAFFESIFETVYAVGRKVVDLPGENPEQAQFKEGVKLFEEKFRTDAVGIWKAIGGDLAGGLGTESALIVDLNGAAPAVPGISQAVIDQAKVPRISIIAPVEDRAKVKASWEQINQSATSILGTVSEMTGTDIPMQKPMSSEKDGLVTWFFPMPFFTDDFLPSVTVSDQWFVTSTSKLQALDLAGQADKGGDGRPGLVFKANFVALQNYAKELQKIVDENAEAIFGGKNDQYEENKEKIQKVIEAIDDLDRLTVHQYKDGDTVRSSLHFKTR